MLALLWASLTFGVIWFGAELNDYRFLGFPLGFYMAAQGLLLLYLLIIWFYNRQMRRLEVEMMPRTEGR